MKSFVYLIAGIGIGACICYSYFKRTPLKSSGAALKKDFFELKSSGTSLKKDFFKPKSEQIDRTLAAKYLEQYIEVCESQGEEKEKILKALKVSKDAITSIFSNKECEALRLYFGKRTAGVPLDPDYTIVLVGVNSENQNINDNIWDECSPCPEDCPKTDF
jgi:hypothetical protein